MLDEDLIKKLREILRKQKPEEEISNEELRVIGLSILRFVLVKELTK